MKLENRERVALFGKTGTGKSHEAKALCKGIIASKQRLAVFDVCDEYSVHGLPDKDVTLGPLRQRMTFDELAENETVLDDPGLQLAVVPTGDPQDVAEQFGVLAQLVRSTGHIVLLAEEVGYWGEFATRKVNELATMARKDGVPLVLVAQRAVQIPRTARSQLSTIISGRQDDEADLRALMERTGPDFAARVAELPPRQTLRWNDTDWTRKNHKKESTHVREA